MAHDLTVTGKIELVEKGVTELAPVAGTAKIPLKIAHVKVETMVGGTKTPTEIKIGFIDAKDEKPIAAGGIPANPGQPGAFGSAPGTGANLGGNLAYIGRQSSIYGVPSPGAPQPPPNGMGGIGGVPGAMNGLQGGNVPRLTINGGVTPAQPPAQPQPNMQPPAGKAPEAQPGDPPRDPKKDMEGMFMLNKIPHSEVYVCRKFFDVSSPGYKDRLESAKKIAKILDKPVDSLKAEALQDRFTAAMVLLAKYRGANHVNGTTAGYKEVPVPEEEAKLILAGLMDGEWNKRDSLSGRWPRTIFSDLNVKPSKLPTPKADQTAPSADGQDPYGAKLVEVYKKWREGNGAKYVMKKFVLKSEKSAKKETEDAKDLKIK